MPNKVFDKETLLDLVVNGVPLFILLFFIGIFAVLPYFGFSGLASIEQFAIVGVSFLALTALTYLAAKAIAGSELSGDVYLPGQASVEGAKPLKEREEERIWELEGRETPAEEKTLAEGDDGTEKAGGVPDGESASTADAETEAVASEDGSEREPGAGADTDTEADAEAATGGDTGADADGEESADADADEEANAS